MKTGNNRFFKHFLLILTGFLILLILWFILAKLIDNPAVPDVTKVISYTVSELISGTIWPHITSSLFRITTGILLSLILAIPAGISLSRSRMFGRIFNPLIYFLHPVPKIAFLPLLLIVFGIADMPKIILVTIILFFPLTITVRDSVLKLDNKYFMLAKSLKLTKPGILKNIILPGILPDLLTALRLSVGISFSILFFAENFATSYGMGYYIMDSWIMTNYIRMYSGILILSLTALMIFLLLDLLSNLLMPYKNPEN